MLPLSLLSVLTTLLAVASSQKCYGLDGNALDDTYAPCNPSATYSSCCATKRTNGTADICLDNGLCMATNNELMGTIWQSGCTDSTGKDVACPKLCPEISTGFSGQSPVSSWNLQTCDYGKYCCRANGDHRSCCSNAFAPRVTTSYVGAFKTSAPTASPSDKSPPAVATASSNPASPDAQLPPATNTCAKEKQATAIVGGTIGSIMGTIILALAYIIFWLNKREQRQRKLKEHYETQFSQTNAYRKALASTTAGSIRESIYMEDMRLKPDELE